jgi:hypothetical protein
MGGPEREVGQGSSIRLSLSSCFFRVIFFAILVIVASVASRPIILRMMVIEWIVSIDLGVCIG